MMETYYRSVDIAYRDDGQQGGILEGRMVPYNVWTEVRSTLEGHFMERIMPGALKKTFQEQASRMRILFHHGLDSLGKQPIAALEEIRDEADGAYYRARLLPSVPSLILDGLRAGLYGASIGMRVPYRADIERRPQKSDYNPQGIEERSVTEAALKEFSVTAFPAYDGATASVRSLTDELMVARLVGDPERLLTLVRSELAQEVEPEHSEPGEEPDPEAEPEEQPEEPKDEPEPVEASRPTPPKKDYLSVKEAEPEWKLP